MKTKESTSEYENPYLWSPCLLAILGIGVFVSMLLLLYLWLGQAGLAAMCNADYKYVRTRIAIQSSGPLIQVQND